MVNHNIDYDLESAVTLEIQTPPAVEEYYQQFPSGGGWHSNRIPKWAFQHPNLCNQIYIILW